MESSKKKASATKSSQKKKDLIIVESPTKAKKITKFLKNKYNVIASNGHIRDLPKSTMGVDIDRDFEPKYLNVRGKGDIINMIRKEAKGANHIYLATDPDREGEAISWHLAHILDIDANENCRIVFNEITEEAVRDSLSHARAIDTHLVDAQQARRVLDRLVGYKISPLLWRKVKRGLSAGRVQSVAARMICDREDEITAFVPEESWSVSAKLIDKASRKKFDARYYGENGKKRELKTKEEADDIINRAKEARFEVRDIKTTPKKKHAPAPFTTSTMQQEASRKLNMTTKTTMRTAQELYEGASLASGLITYMRTDSTRIATSAQQEALSVITERFGTEYAPKTPNFYKSKKSAQDAHEAIRPTSLKNTPESLRNKLTTQQYKLYKLIYERFLASQMTQALYETTTIAIDANDMNFRASGTCVIFDGFTVIYREATDDEKELKLPMLTVGQELKTDSITSEQHFTQPPPRYTEASLVKALEDFGIGRPSTYAPTISTIIDRGYVRREKKTLFPTELGKIVTDIMKSNFSDIVNLKFTADMEEKLDSVEEGSDEWKHIVRDFYGPFEKTLAAAEENIEKIKLKDEVSDVPCDKCGTMMVYKIGRYGKFLACPNFPECQNTKPILEKISAPCPKCGAAIVKRRAKGRGRLFYGCERYPDCDFVSWDMPLSDKCSVCGSYMVEHKSAQNSKRCSNPDCVTNSGAKKTTRGKSAKKSEEQPPTDV